MNREIVSIGLSAVKNDELKSRVSVVELSISPCKDVSEATRLLERRSCCLIVLDASLMDISSAETAIRVLREITFAPILVLSPRPAAAFSLEVGADVCMPPETGMDILKSQAMALIRRNEIYNHYDPDKADSIVFHRGDLVIDLRRYSVTQGGVPIHLQRREFRLLALFARNPGIVLTTERISEAVWMDEDTDSHNVTVAIAELRHKLNDDKSNPTYIETVHGIGYRFLPSK